MEIKQFEKRRVSSIGVNLGSHIKSQEVDQPMQITLQGQQLQTKSKPLNQISVTSQDAGTLEHNSTSVIKILQNKSKMVMNKTATSEIKNGQNYLTNRINEQSSDLIPGSKILSLKKDQYHTNEDTQQDETSGNPNLASREEQTFEKYVSNEMRSPVKRSESISHSNKNSIRSFKKEYTQQESNYQTQQNSSKRVNEKRSNQDLSSILNNEPKMPGSNSKILKYKRSKMREANTPQQVQNNLANISSQDYMEYDSQQDPQSRQMINKRSKSQISLVKGGKQLSNGEGSQCSGPSTGINNTKLLKKSEEQSLQIKVMEQAQFPLNIAGKDSQSIQTNDLKTNAGSLRPFTRNIEKSYDFNPFINEDIGLNIETKTISQIDQPFKNGNLKIPDANNMDLSDKRTDDMTFQKYSKKIDHQLIIDGPKALYPQMQLNVVSGPNAIETVQHKQGIFAPNNSKLRGPSVPKTRPKPLNQQTLKTQQEKHSKQTQNRQKQTNVMTPEHTEIDTVLSDISHHVVLIQGSPKKQLEEISVIINTTSSFDKNNKVPTLRTTPTANTKTKSSQNKTAGVNIQNPVLSPRPGESSKLKKKVNSPFFNRTSVEVNKDKLLEKTIGSPLKQSQENGLSSGKKSSGKHLHSVINSDLDGLTFPQPSAQKHSVPVQTSSKESQITSPKNNTFDLSSPHVGMSAPDQPPQPKQEAEAEAYKSAVQAMNNLSKKKIEDQLITQAQINRSGTRGFFDRPKHQLIQQKQTHVIPINVKNTVVNGQSMGSMVTINSGGELMPPKITSQQITSGVASPKTIIEQLVHNNSSAQRILKKDDTLQMIQGGVGLLNQNSKTHIAAESLSFNKENDFIPTMPKISAQTIQQQFLKRNQRIIYRDEQDAKTQKFIFENKEPSNETALKTNEKAFSQSFYNQPQYALRSNSRSNSKNEMPNRSPKRSEVHTANIASKTRDQKKYEPATARSQIPQNALPHLLQHTAYDAFEQSRNESNFRSTQKSGMRLVNQMLQTMQNPYLQRNPSNNSSKARKRRIEVKNILANNKYFKKHIQPIHVNDYKSLTQVLGFKSDINNLRNLNQPQTLLKTAVQQNQVSPKADISKIYVVNKFRLNQRSSNVGSIILQNHAGMQITFDSDHDEDYSGSSEDKDTPTRNLSSVQTKYASFAQQPYMTQHSQQQASIQQFLPGVNKLNKIAKLNQSPRQERETVIMRKSIKGHLTARGSVPTIKQQNIETIANVKEGFAFKNSLPEMTPQALTQISSFYDKRASAKRRAQNEFINTQDMQTSRSNLHTNADLVESQVLQTKFNAIKLIKPMNSKEKINRNPNYLAQNFTSKTASLEGSNVSGSAVKKNASYIFDKGPFKIEENVKASLQNNTINELQVPQSSTQEQRSLDSSTNLTARMVNQKNEQKFQTESILAEDSIVRIQEDSAVKESLVKKNEDSLIQESLEIEVADTEHISLNTPQDTSTQLPARLSDFLKKPQLNQSVPTPFFEQNPQMFSSTQQQFKMNDQRNIMKVVSNQHPLKRVLPLKNMPMNFGSSNNSRTSSPGRRGSAFSSIVQFQTVDDTMNSSLYNQQQIVQNQRAVFKIKAQAKDQKTKSKKSGTNQSGMSKTGNFNFRPINSTIVQFNGLPNIQPKMHIEQVGSASSDYTPINTASEQTKNPQTARPQFRQTAPTQNWINAPQFSQPRLSSTITGFPTQRTSKNFKHHNAQSNKKQIDNNKGISSPHTIKPQTLKNDLASFGTLQTSVPSSPHATRNITQNQVTRGLIQNSQIGASKRRNISLNLQEKFVRQNRSQVRHTLSSQRGQEMSPQRVTVGAVALQQPKNQNNIVLNMSMEKKYQTIAEAKASPIQQNLNK